MCFLFSIHCRIGPVLTWFGSNGVESNSKVNESYEPWGICCDSRDNVIVTDHNNHKVQVRFSINL